MQQLDSMKANRKLLNRKAPGRKSPGGARPDYYLTPSHDFTQYTRDCEEKYWSRDTAFDWSADVMQSLSQNLDQLQRDKPAFERVVFMVIPMVMEKVQRKQEEISLYQLPLEEDALKDIGECLPSGGKGMEQALQVLVPLVKLENASKQIRDQADILQRELVDLQELQRLGLMRNGIGVGQLETGMQRQEQAEAISRLSGRLQQLKCDLAQTTTENGSEWKRLKQVAREELRLVEPLVLEELQETGEFLNRIQASQQLPPDEKELSRLKELILKRQLRALKDIANHALVVEQSAIAPLTMGIIHYKRYREIQEAMTTFIRDEAKHSATFRRFLVEKLEAKEYISAILIKGANRYMWLARFLPATGMFLAVIVEIIGAAYLEFFANEKYMPDKLFCSICTTISTQDEKRHIDLCVAMYNELFRKASTWERIRNQMALRRILQSVYGDKDESHHLIQAFRAFGVESGVLYKHITDQLSSKLARIGTYVEPEQLLRIILGKKAAQVRLEY